MKFIDKLNPYTHLQQSVILLGFIRVLIATVVILLLKISLWFQWGLSSKAVDWFSIGSYYLLLIFISIITLFMRRRYFNTLNVFILLLADVFLWFLLLRETGGAMNPASIYFLILLLLSTLVLPVVMTFFVFCFILALYTYMMLIESHSLHSIIGLHLWGMWLLLFFTAIIIMVSIHWLSTRIRTQEKAITAFKESTYRSEQLVMMGTMAASAAHELATPLSTIAMLAEESAHEDAILILQQVERCKQCLQQLKNIPNQETPIKQHSFNCLNALKHDLLLIKPQAYIEIADEADCMISVALTLRQALLA